MCLDMGSSIKVSFDERSVPLNTRAVSPDVILGLALILMWKVFTTIHDRREFAR